MTFDLLIYCWIAIAAITFVYLLKRPAPYGRHTQTNWGPMISNRGGWFIMELPVLLFVAYYFSQTELVTSIQSILLLLFIFHYVNRVFVYPFRIRTKGKKMPLVIALSAVVFNLINGTIIGYYTIDVSSYQADYLTSIQFIGGGVLFVIGLIINWQSDTILISLRAPGETGYKIPTGGFFKWVSCPNFFGELVEWLGFAIMCSNVAGWSFFIWTFANLVPRAIDHHRWYQRTFNNYPKERKAVLPYLV